MHGTSDETGTGRTSPGATNDAPLIRVEGVNFWYGEKQALFDVDLDIYRREVIAFMGPSGCGKSTLLKMLNRMQDETRGARMTGRILLDGEDINAEDVDPVMLRRRFGWVAQAPNPFSSSVYENIAYGPRLHGLVEDADLGAHVRQCLERAELAEELEGRLDDSGLDLSGGQQQRLCIARALSIMPDVLLMDEPCSSIDPIATSKIEGLIHDLRRDHAVVIITHNLEQARRLADRVAFFYMGRLIEVGPTEQIFGHPAKAETARYLTGAFG